MEGANGQPNGTDVGVVGLSSDDDSDDDDGGGGDVKS